MGPECARIVAIYVSRLDRCRVGQHFHGCALPIFWRHDGGIDLGDGWARSHAHGRVIGVVYDRATETAENQRLQPGWSPEPAMRGEIDEYNKWAEGDVWGHIVEKLIPECGHCGMPQRWEPVEDGSVWGFIGYDYAKSEAFDALRLEAGVPTGQRLDHQTADSADQARTRAEALAAPDSWVEYYPREVHDAGDVGGDMQAGEAWTRTFVRWLPDVGLWALVNQHFYSAYPDVMAEGDPDHVVHQTEYMICRDFAEPGDTEVYADNRYEDLEPNIDHVNGDDSRQLAEETTSEGLGDPRLWRESYRWFPDELRTAETTPLRS